VITDLKPYPSMKDSGVEWLGEVPKHWEVRRLRTISEMRVSNVDKHTKEDEAPVRLCNYVDVYKNDYISERMDFLRATATTQEIERFRLAADDVLITKDSETWDDIGVPALVLRPANDLISGYHLALLRPFTGLLVGSYLFRALQSKVIAYQFHVEAHGVTRYGLSHASIKSVWLPLPSIPEQASIVRFLNHADRRISKYIHAKQKLVGLLEEQKQAIIHRTVTRGLDPNVPLKDSGVEWLREVPAHWDVKQVRSVARIVRGGSPRPAGSPLYFHGSDKPWITVGEITKDIGMYLDFTKTRLTPEGVKRSRVVEKGTLLLTNSGATLGVPKITNIQGCINDGVAVFLNIRPTICKEFLYYYLTTQTTHLKASVDLGAQPNLNTQIIGGWPVLLPPLGEQLRVVEHIQEAIPLCMESVVRTHREIKLLREFRTRLIADVVTGKLDVREAAANLPAQLDEESVLDEASAHIDGEEVLELEEVLEE